MEIILCGGASDGRKLTVDNGTKIISVEDPNLPSVFHGYRWNGCSPCEKHENRYLFFPTGSCDRDPSELELLKKLYSVVDKMPFGEYSALPWCRESFPELDKAMAELHESYNPAIAVHQTQQNQEIN